MRAFVAIDLPESVRTALRRTQESLRSVASDARWTRPEGVHLTLKFLGEIADAKVSQVTECLKHLGNFEAFTVGVKGFGFFPDARRPKVFWAGVEAPAALGQLAEKVDQAIQQVGIAREDRAFRPHLTLARFNVPQPQSTLQALLARQGDDQLGNFEVSDFFLFESKLSPHGAEYRKVERFP